MTALEIALTALHHIASWSEGLEVTSTFDEPASTANARRALQAIKELEPEMNCLITGCALLDPDQDRGVWGDLHIIGGAYVFNACLNAGQTAWTDSPRIMDNVPSITFSGPESQMFERRGVIVLDIGWCVPNEAARVKIDRKPSV